MRLIIAFVAFTSLFLTSPVNSQSADFEKNTGGLQLNDMRNKTLVGVTRKTSKVWSVYLASNGDAHFHYSTGNRAVARWEQKSKRILCFTKVVENDPNREICKRTPPLGRGMDWMTVTLKKQNGNTVWQNATDNERRGSSQIVYAFEGKQEVAKNSIPVNTEEWAGHLIVGRTLQDKEVWFATLEHDNTVRFIFGSGREASGTYKIKGSQICLEFHGSNVSASCRIPVRENGKVLWKSASGGKTTSEVVYMKPLVKPGPARVHVVSSAGYRGLVHHSLSDTLAAYNPALKGITTLFDSLGLKPIGNISGKVSDLEFSTVGDELLLVRPDAVEIRSTTTGELKFLHDNTGEAYIEGSLSRKGNKIFVARADGTVQIIEIRTGTVSKPIKFSSFRITDLTVTKDNWLLATTNGGEIVVFNEDRGIGPKPTEIVNRKMVRVIFKPHTNSFYALSRNGILVSGSINEAGDLTPLQKLETGSDETYSFALREDGSEIFISGRNKSIFVDTDTWAVKQELGISEHGNLFYSAYMTGSDYIIGSIFSNGKYQGLEVWSRNEELTQEWKPIPSVYTRSAERRAREFQKAQKAQRDKYNQLMQAAVALFRKGECDQLLIIQQDLLLKDQRTEESCLEEADKRQKEATYDSLITSLQCDKARSFRLENGVGTTIREKQCFEESGRKSFQSAIRNLECDSAKAIFETTGAGSIIAIQKCRKELYFQKNLTAFDQAIADGNCTMAEELGKRVGKPEGGADCALEQALASTSARRVYLAAAKFDAANDRARAKILYTAVMDKYPDDDLAIDAANRLTQLNDLETMETKQAETEAALAEANEDKAKAEIARQQAEARAIEAERLAAEAAQRANSQPRRNSACDHVSHGMYFEFNGGGLFGVANGRWEVIGINREGGIVTARKTGQDFRRQISCHQVR